MSPEVKAGVIGAVATVVASIMGIAYVKQDDSGPTIIDDPPPEESSVDVPIYAHLGQTQCSMAVNVEIDGDSEGDLQIQSDRRPEASMKVSLKPGPHSFEIRGETSSLAQDGVCRLYPVTGEGTISVSEGESFEIQGGFSGTTLVVDLVEVS